MFALLKAISLETNLLVMLDNLTLKNANLGREICFFTKNRFGRNDIYCAEDDHCFMSIMCKIILRFIDKISIFQEGTPYFLDQLRLPCKFYSGNMYRKEYSYDNSFKVQITNRYYSALKAL